MLKETHLWRTRDCRALRLGVRVYWDEGVVHQDADMLAYFLSSMECRDYPRRNEVESYMPRLLFLMKLNLPQELDVKNWTVQLPNLCFTYAHFAILFHSKRCCQESFPPWCLVPASPSRSFSLLERVRGRGTRLPVLWKESRSLTSELHESSWRCSPPCNPQAPPPSIYGFSSVFHKLGPDCK